MNYKEARLSEEELKRQKEREESKIAAEVTADFLRRREERRSIESGWILNINFLSGNQYCDVSPLGGVMEEDKQFYWQARRVFNHIAPTIDSRIAKLEKMKPELTVRAFSDEDGDMKAAKLATGILKYVQDRIGLNELSSRALMWSETCGCAFFKVGWNALGGRQVGVDEENNPVYEGEVQVSVVPPFEVFPDRLDAEDLDGIQSLIHARTVPVSYIQERFGVALKGRDITGMMQYSEPSAGKLPGQKMGMNFTDVKDAEHSFIRTFCPSSTANETSEAFPLLSRIVCACPVRSLVRVSSIG